jgi:GGDEF domain-containing protein
VNLRLRPEDGSRVAEGSYALRSRHTGETIAFIGDGLQITYVDPGFLSFFGYVGVEGDDEDVLRQFDRGIDLDDELVIRWHELISQPGSQDRIEIRLCAADGSWRWARMDIENRLDLDDDPHLSVHALDMTEVRQAEDRWKDAVAKNARLTEIIEATSDLVVMTDPDGTPLWLNSAAQGFFDFVAEDPTADDLLGRFAPWARRRYEGEVLDVLRKDGIWTGDLAVTRGEDEIAVAVQYLAHRDPDGEIGWLSMVARDIRGQRDLETRLKEQATHDELTGLPNRTLLMDRLRMALSRIRRTGNGVAVLFCDLDHFKVVNDSLGHAVGDRLLVDTSRRLVEALRPGDTVARFGGDEFVILCDELPDQEDATGVALRVPHLLDRSY